MRKRNRCNAGLVAIPFLLAGIIFNNQITDFIYGTSEDRNRPAETFPKVTPHHREDWKFKIPHEIPYDVETPNNPYHHDPNYRGPRNDNHGLMIA